MWLQLARLHIVSLEPLHLLLKQALTALFNQDGTSEALQSNHTIASEYEHKMLDSFRFDWSRCSLSNVPNLLGHHLEGNMQAVPKEWIECDETDLLDAASCVHDSVAAAFASVRKADGEFCTVPG